MWCGHGPSSVVCEVICDRAFKWNAIFMNLYSCRVPTNDTNINKSTVMRFWSATVSRFCVRLTSKRKDLEHSPCNHETWSIRCHVGIHVDFYIPRAFTYSVGPPSVVWRETWIGPAFSITLMSWNEVALSFNLLTQTTPNWELPHPNLS